jgi:Ca-activated chloride channel family protein
LLGYENRRIADRDFRNDTVDAGEVGAGHAVTALYEIKLSDDVQGRIAANTANETTLPDRR